MDIPKDFLKRKEKKERGIHSYVHILAKEISEYVGEREKYGMWLGVTKRVGVEKMKGLLQQIKEKGIKNPRYLLACTKKPII